MKLNVWILIYTVVILTGCNNENEEVVRSYHMNGKPEKVEYLDRDSNVVKTVEYYKNGNKKMEGGVKNGAREGEWSFWYEDGKLWSRGTFRNGKSHGRFLSYNEQGLLFQESNYREGIPDGKWAYYKNDKRIKEVYYENGNIVNELDL